MKRKPKRHCWECRRRCLVCDFTEPACKRCSSSGVECPGYGDAKPMRLKWLAPGKVPSRGRQKASTQCWIIPRLELDVGPNVFSEGAEYYNSCIHVEMLPMHELGYNPHLYPVSAALIRVGAGAPDYLRLGMVCMVLGHRLNRFRSQPQSKAALTEKFYRYWGLAVRSLNEQLDSEDTRGGDMVIAGMLTLLLADIHNGTSLNWRCHLDAVYRLIMLRGGLDALAESKSLYPVLLSFWSIAVFGNTTSPATDLSHTAAHLAALPFLLQQYSTAVGPFQFCPLPLFAELICINHLRAVATTATFSLQPSPDQEHPLFDGKTNNLSDAAWSILTRIEHAFSPSAWAEHKSGMSKPLDSSPSPTGGDVSARDSREDWLLIGRIYQAATALYCILSLYSLSPSLFESPTTADTTTTAQLDRDLILKTRCAAHARLLHALLAEGLTSPRMKRFLIWPLVVLGVCAHPCHGFLSSHIVSYAEDGGVDGLSPVSFGWDGGSGGGEGEEDGLQEWVVSALRELSCYAGSCVPLTAEGVLSRYWNVAVPGAEGWDRCFDRPYVFTGQVAIDTKALYGL